MWNMMKSVEVRLFRWCKKPFIFPLAVAPFSSSWRTFSPITLPYSCLGVKWRIAHVQAPQYSTLVLDGHEVQDDEPTSSDLVQ